MSLLTPTKPVKPADFHAALLVLKSYTVTLLQAAQLVDAITIDEEGMLFAPCTQDMACELNQAHLAELASHVEEGEERVRMPSTISRFDQPRWVQA